MLVILCAWTPWSALNAPIVQYTVNESLVQLVENILNPLSHPSVINDLAILRAHNYKALSHYKRCHDQASEACNRNQSVN